MCVCDFVVCVEMCVVENMLVVVLVRPCWRHALVPRCVCIFRPRVMKKHDCTHIESLFSTYPYLTDSNKKTTSPVMTIQSTVGLREKISIDTKVNMLWRRAETRNHSSCFPSLHFEQAPPPPSPHLNKPFSSLFPPLFSPHSPIHK